MTEIEKLLMVLCLELVMTGKITNKADELRQEIINIDKQQREEIEKLRATIQED